MSRPCKASSLDLLLALTLAACGGDPGGDDGGTGDTDTSSAPATTDAPASTGASGEPASTGAPTSAADTDEPPPATDTGDPPSTSSGADTGTSTGADPCADSIVTWENFGESFFLTWCTGCHHSALPSAERACAPCGANFDTHAGASERAQIVKLRVLDWETVQGVTPMPPAANLPEDDLALLREWIDCGAKGPESGQPGMTCPDPGTPVDGC